MSASPTQEISHFWGSAAAIYSLRDKRKCCFCTNPGDFDDDNLKMEDSSFFKQSRHSTGSSKNCSGKCCCGAAAAIWGGRNYPRCSPGGLIAQPVMMIRDAGGAPENACPGFLGDPTLTSPLPNPTPATHPQPTNTPQLGLEHRFLRRSGSLAGPESPGAGWA